MDSETCDLLVIGSGAGALCAALTAATEGLSVIVVEKEHLFGGASARSGGALWIPANHLARAAGIVDSIEDAITYIRYEAGGRFDEARVRTYLKYGPEMLVYIERHSPVRFDLLLGMPDYHCDSPGGAKGARAVSTRDWNAAPLGNYLRRLRPPLMTSTFLGMQVSIMDIGFFMTAGRKLGSLLHVLLALGKHFLNCLRHGTSTRVSAGNALVAGLASAALSKGARLYTSCPARSLIKTPDRIAGAIVERDGKLLRIEASRGVVIATGGFPHDSVRRAEQFPSGATSPEVWAQLPYGNSGDGIRLAEELGARFDDDMKTSIALTPLARIDQREGALETMPMFFNRGAPGVIAVTRDGKRFCNEAVSYHDFGVALLEKLKGDPNAEAVAWFVCDHRALRRYGFGPIRPAPMPYRHYCKKGIVKAGRTIAELAHAAGIDSVGLEATIQDFNRHAALGEDPAYARGTNAYQLQTTGDADHRPNPCVGPLASAPFYAIRVFAGSVGTFAGLATDAYARVRSKEGGVLTGLYAIGNDMASISGGDYISGGITLGPAMTFGHIAALHAASRIVA